MSAGRVRRLEELGFIWDRFGSAWEKRLNELQAFKKDHGHCNVPAAYKDNPQLARWVVTQRNNYKQGKLEDEYIRGLEALGFTWDFHAQLWEERFSQLLAFKKAHDHCNVPATYKDNPQLGAWVSRLRKDYKKGKLENRYISRLDALGFTWDPYVELWEERFSQLLAFKKEHGHCNVPQKKKLKYPKLGLWVSTQRQMYKQGKLGTDHIRRLEDIGFVWSTIKKAG